MLLEENFFQWPHKNVLIVEPVPGSVLGGAEMTVNTSSKQVLGLPSAVQLKASTFSKTKLTYYSLQQSEIRTVAKQGVSLTMG